jgi:hypothetical protein
MRVALNSVQIVQTLILDELTRVLSMFYTEFSTAVLKTPEATLRNKKAAPT